MIMKAQTNLFQVSEIKVSTFLNSGPLNGQKSQLRKMPAKS